MVITNVRKEKFLVLVIMFIRISPCQRVGLELEWSSLCVAVVLSQSFQNNTVYMFVLCVVLSFAAATNDLQVCMASGTKVFHTHAVP